MPSTQHFAILGATGKVGFATSSALRKAGIPVRAILRDASKAARLEELGCEIAVADMHNSEALAKAIGDAEAVQIILPPVPQAKDAAGEMRAVIESIAVALESARPKRILAVSDYGAHVAKDIGMPTVFHAFEERLSRVPGNKVFLRSAEHMENWVRRIPVAMASGTLPSFHTAVDTLYPTIAASDLGQISADILLQPKSEQDVSIVHAEGPRRYTANDVAMTLTELLGKTINVEVVPRSQWNGIFEAVMSPTFADLLIKSTDAQIEGGLVDVELNGEVRYGSTELMEALRPIVKRHNKQSL